LELQLENINDDQAAGLIGEYPRIMRRPLLSDGRRLAVGFDPEQYASLLK